MGSASVASWYNENVDLEDKRLDLFFLEHAVTSNKINELLRTLSQPNGCDVVDIGCGPGRYALELARSNNRVTISDISSVEIDLALKKAEAAGLKFEYSSVDDACRVREDPRIFRPHHYDLILLLGPLYHVMEKKNRLQLLATTLEMVKPGGFVMAAFVNKNAHLRDLTARDPQRILAEKNFYQQYLQTGHYNREGSVHMYHTSPREIRELLSELATMSPSFQVTSLVACEGFLGSHCGSNLTKLDTEHREEWIKLAIESSEDENNLGASDHIVAVLRRETF